jgi:hypothetical protein
VKFLLIVCVLVARAWDHNSGAARSSLSPA